MSVGQRARSMVAKLRTRHSRGATFTPRQVVQTLRLQRRVRGAGRVYVTGRAVVKLRAGATIEMTSGSRLLFGSGGTNDVMDGDRLRAAIYLAPGATLRVDGKVRLSYGTKIRVGPGCTLTLGDGVYVNARCLVIANRDVTIGAGTQIGWDCQIIDDSFHSIRRPDGGWSDVKRPISIGERCWLGSGVLVLAGVSVGSGSVVAARSVVTKDVERDTLVGGTPARPIRTDIEWRP